MKDTIESKVSKTVLQQQEEVIIGDEIYKVSPPSVATLILASEAISQLPYVNLDSKNIASESLYVAKDCRVLGDIIAILILGAKGLKETRTVVKERFFGLIKKEYVIIIDHKANLSKKLLEGLQPRELHETLARLLNTLQIGDFFGLTASLIEINLLRQTREAGTTAFGQ
ncbi:MAG: hypothetical protein LBG18_09235 [Mediterranea sp.]|jgi:hypothetical protein|nr:hypothetical protein [Mediterranea sp.]